MQKTLNIITEEDKNVANDIINSMVDTDSCNKADILQDMIDGNIDFVKHQEIELQFIETTLDPNKFNVPIIAQFLKDSIQKAEKQISIFKYALSLVPN